MPYAIDNKEGTRTWYAYVTFNGKRIRRRAGSTRREAVELESELRSRYRKGQFNPFAKPSDPVFEEFSEKFLTWSRTNKRSHKRDGQLVSSLKRWFEGRKLSTVGPGDVETFKIERKAEKAQSGKNEFVSNATVNREVACLKRMFNLAVQWKDAQRNPVQGVKMLPESPKQERYINEEEFQRLHEAAFENIKPVLLVAYHTGMRTEEFLSLTWSQVHLNDPPVKMVGDVLNFGDIEVYKTKNGQTRRVPINETLWNCFTQKVRTEDDYVFKASHGGRYTSIKDQFKHALKKAELKPARIHDLRGSWATRMNERGVDPYTIMEIGGWASLSQLQRYLRLNHRNMVVAMQTLDAPHLCHIDAIHKEVRFKKSI